MKKNTADIFWGRVSKGARSACWPFTGDTFSGRYGRFSWKGKSEPSHRVAYMLSAGAIPHGLFVMHKCNNKLCCNPSHLTLGTNAENQRHASASNAWRAGKTGIKGVGFDAKRGYWTAQAFQDGKRRNLYTGPHKDKAVLARKRWEQENNITFNQ